MLWTRRTEKEDGIAVLLFFTFGDEEVKRFLIVAIILPQSLLYWIVEHIFEEKENNEKRN